MFDIGNTSVGGAVVRLGEFGHAPQILHALRLEMSMIENPVPERLLRETSSALLEVAEKLSRLNSEKITGIHTLLASPWYASETRVLKIENKKPFVCDESLVQGAISKEITAVKKVIASRQSESEKEIEAIESRIIQMKCNGYEARHSLGKTINEAEIYLYIGVAPTVVLNKFSEAILRSFKNISVQYHSFPLAYYSVIRDSFPSKTDYLLIDVSGEVTDITMVRKGALLETVSFPQGRNFIFRKLGEVFRQSPESVRSLLSPTYRRNANDASSTKLKQTLQEAKKEWLNSLRGALTKLSRELYIPEEVFLTIDHDVAKIISSWVLDDSLTSLVLTHKKLTIIPTDYHNVVNLEAHKDKAIYDDHFLSIGSLFAQKIIGSKTLEGVQ